LPTRSGVSGPGTNVQGRDRPPGAGGGVGQLCFTCAMRRWLPNGSRRPKSMP
jgi:hypothetical protein